MPTVTKKSSASSKKEVYLKILNDYEKEKDRVLKTFLEKAAKVKKQGMKKLEKAMTAEELKSTEKLLENL